MGMISGVSETKKGVAAFFRYDLDFGGCIWFENLFSGQWSIIYVKFLTGSHLLLLIISLVTEKFGLRVVYRPTCFMISKIPPKALGNLQRFPDSPAGGGGGLRVRFSSLQEPCSPLPFVLKRDPTVLDDVRLM